RGPVTLSPAEVLALLTEDVAGYSAERGPRPVTLAASPLGPTGAAPAMAGPVVTTGNQFYRTTLDVADYLKRHGRVPPAVWPGSEGGPPGGIPEGARPGRARPPGGPGPGAGRGPPGDPRRGEVRLRRPARPVGLGDLPAGLPGAAADGPGQTPGLDAQAGGTARVGK